MKLTRILAALFVAMSLPVAAFAATGQGTISSVTGTVNASNNGTTTELRSDSAIRQGDSIETGAGSAVEIQLSGGATLVLGPSTKIVLKTLQDADVPGVYSYEIILLRGSLSGNAAGGAAGTTGSNLSVRTTAGVANVAGTRFALDFVPTSLTTGNLTAVTSAGPISVLPSNGLTPVTVPAGGQVIVGPTITPQVTPASRSALARANGTPAPAYVAPTPVRVANGNEIQQIRPDEIVTRQNFADVTPTPIPNMGQVNIYNPTIPNSTLPVSNDGSGSLN